MSRSLSPTLYHIGRWVCRQTLGRYFSLRVSGLEHLPDGPDGKRCLVIRPDADAEPTTC